MQTQGRDSMKKTALFMILLLVLAVTVNSETANLPGKINSLCHYDNFFYNLPEADFLFYFNDALMNTEPPGERIYDGGMRDKYFKLVQQHRQVKKFITTFGNSNNLSLSLDLKNEQGLDQAKRFLALLGLSLKKTSSGALELNSIGEDPQTNYYLFCRLNASSLQKQLNQTGMFFFKLQETTVPMPWDYGFLSAISGKAINAETFFEQLIANKRFSFLLSILFRLSSKEIDFISQAKLNGTASAWKRLYMDSQSLMGLLVLSSALRVRDGRLFFPGGDKARKFWSAMAGIDPEQAPLDFLTHLGIIDDGKLNYLFVFSFFLPEENRRVLFFDYDANKVRRLYQKITLGANEKIKANSFPRLESFTYYSLLHLLKIQDGRIHLPLGVNAWAQAMGLELAAGADECDFLENLLVASAKSSRKPSLLQKFITIYSKFNDRPGFLTQDFLKKTFVDFEAKNILLDFIERIPLKKAESADALFTWQDNLLKLNKKDQVLLTALSQSLLEIIAHLSWFAPDRFDYDRMIGSLMTIPWQRPVYYDRMFDFIKEQTSVDSLRDVTDESFLAFVLSGLKNQAVSIQGQAYEWRVKEMYAAILSGVLRSQEDCTLSVLSEINSLLNNLAETPAGFSKRSGRRLLEAFEQLPYPAFSKDAPKSIKLRVMAYAKSDLDRDVQNLLKKSEKNADRDEIKKIVAEIKGNYLLPNLKDFFLTLAYALNAKSPKLRMFINPNISRLHDFSENNDIPWSNNSSPGNKTEFSGYYLKGGVSRLNLTFALNWRNQLFDKSIYNSEQTLGIIYNIMSMLPQPKISQSASFDALLVEFSVELLQKCSSDEKLKKAVSDAVMMLTAGYHYRRLNDFLSGRAADYYLFMSELQQIGLYFFKNDFLLDEFSKKDVLEKYARMPLSAVIAGENDLWGNIYYNSSGSLCPRANVFIPQEIAHLFASGWLSGELVREYKIKTAYLASKNNFPVCLLGQFVFDYIDTVCKPIYAQNHIKDYFSTFFVLDIMNSAHLKNTVKKLRQKGFLRLK